MRFRLEEVYLELRMENYKKKKQHTITFSESDIWSAIQKHTYASYLVQIAKSKSLFDKCKSINGGMGYKRLKQT